MPADTASRQQMKPKNTTSMGVNLQQRDGGTEVIIEEHSVAYAEQDPAYEPLSSIRYHSVGVFSRLIAKSLESRLKQRFSTPGEPLDESDIAYIKMEIESGTI